MHWIATNKTHENGTQLKMLLHCYNANGLFDLHNEQKIQMYLSINLSACH